ncbi:MAG: protein kinase [Kofleriaceae bacterium]
MMGEVIQGYRVDRSLSVDKGGFGDVFFATHQGSGTEAVVKVLKPEMSANHEFVQRFFNEARAAATIHHPGIVQIHNAGYHGARAYLLMERLRGEDLESRLAAGPPPLEQTLRFMRQTASAIGAAHDRAIVHRDLKPANLFIVSDPDIPGGERIKVLDFGIAKLSMDAGAGQTRGVFGTPAYMSPEQCSSTAAVDHRSDLYSIGCIFYQLVCGAPPFGFGGAELIAAHLRDAPVPPRAYAPSLPAAIDALILALLEKSPGRRPQTCAALAQALDEIMGGLASLSNVRVSASMPRTIVVPSASAVVSAVGPAAPHATSAPSASTGSTAPTATAPVGGPVSPVGFAGGSRPPDTFALGAARSGTAPAASTTGSLSGSRRVATTLAPAPELRRLGLIMLGAVLVGGGVGLALLSRAPSSEERAPARGAVRSAAGDAAPTADAPRAPAHAAPAVDAALVISAESVAEQWNDLGREAMIQQRYPSALEAFRNAVATVPSDPRYRFNLGLAALHAGDCAEAITELQHAIELAEPKLADKATRALRSSGCLPDQPTPAE